MASFNRVILLGNLTRDVDVRYLQGGSAVCDIGLAVNDRRKNAAGEWIEETTFVDVTLWGRTAEVAGEYLSKGDPVLIEGRLKLDQWETDGQKRSKLKVVGEKMQLLGAKGSGGGGGASGGTQPGGGGGNFQRGSAGTSGGGQPQYDESDYSHSGDDEPSHSQDDIPF